MANHSSAKVDTPLDTNAIVSLLGNEWRLDLADADAFAGITAVVIEATRDMTEQCEQVLQSQSYPRLDGEAMLAEATARAKKAPPGSHVYKPGEFAIKKQ